jgi:hypothetical protein
MHYELMFSAYKYFIEKGTENMKETLHQIIIVVSKRKKCCEAVFFRCRD